MQEPKVHFRLRVPLLEKLFYLKHCIDHDRPIEDEQGLLKQVQVNIEMVAHNAWMEYLVDWAVVVVRSAQNIQHSQHVEPEPAEWNV